MSQVNFIFCLHNHQPVGNFENVFEDAYRRAYEPFFGVADRFPEIKLCLHYSGSLLEWIERAHPKFITRLQKGVADKRIELLGGGFYEPILTMLSDEDKLGQINLFSDYLKKRFGKRPRGVWLAERVWEQSLVKPLSQAGIEYTVVDDYHFKTTGFADKQLNGYYITEDQGKTLNVFSIPELLRYAIPFRTPLETINYLYSKPHQAVITYADDGEKFGIWPKTYQHCYDEKWLENFFKALQEAISNKWLKTITFSDALDTIKPVGKAYLPDCSYREMTEWALPVDVGLAYEDIMKRIPKSDLFIIQPGGYWNNFKVKYPEINIMYSRMLEVSNKTHQLKGAAKENALGELYRGQGNCAYWHGIFGGFYLPHLRHAMYQHLIAADRIASRKTTAPNHIEVQDYDRDGSDEIKISNKDINCYIKPSQGGAVYEYDITEKEFNPLATLARRREAYHAKILQSQAQNAIHNIATIHDLVVAKTPGLENLLYYDDYLKQSLLDHFLSSETSIDDLFRGNYIESGNFLAGEYSFEVNDTGKSVTLSCNGTVKQTYKLFPVCVEKTVSFAPKDPLSLVVEYTITNSGEEALSTVFAVEFNLSMLAGNAHDRYYYDGSRPNIGPLITTGKAERQKIFGIKDEYQKIDFAFHLDKPTDFWFFPVQTISQSEGGFELIYQSSVILPRWQITLEPDKKWSTRIIKKAALI